MSRTPKKSEMVIEVPEADVSKEVFTAEIPSSTPPDEPVVDVVDVVDETPEAPALVVPPAVVRQHPAGAPTMTHWLASRGVEKVELRDLGDTWLVTGLYTQDSRENAESVRSDLATAYVASFRIALVQSHVTDEGGRLRIGFEIREI